MTDPGEITIRPSSTDDADAIAGVWLASFKATYDFPPAHSDDEVRGWVRSEIAPRDETWVAAARAGTVVGFMSLDDDGIDQLYLAPGWWRRGVGSRLVRLAKSRRPDGLALWTFQANTGARAFYEHHGFEVDRLGDGDGNEERQPDVRYVWEPRADA